MSTDRQRVKRAIQRIAVQAPELRSLLEAAESKGGKPKSAGVGGGSGAGGGDAQETRICCDGSVSDDGNPGVEERDPQDGDQDGLNPDDPADLSGLDGGCLTGVTDCDTGDPLCFCGDDWLPPDGWDGPTDPPLIENYEDGIYWEYQGIYGITPCMAAENYYAGISNITMLDCNYLGFINQSYKIEVQLNDSSGATYWTDPLTVERLTCPSGSVEDYCNPSEEEIRKNSWPEDSCTNLAIKSGKIVGSKYDPENDGSWSAPRDSIDLCSGGDQISLAPAANGGWKTINSTNDSGYLYDLSGKVIAHIDGNEYSDPAI